MAEVAGVGIFLTPATLLRTFGTGSAALIAWLIMGALSVAGALCFAELATRFPRAGGLYVFLENGYGRETAVAYGWMAILVMDPGLTAALAIGFAQYTLAAAGADPGATRFAATLAILGGALLATRAPGVNAWVLRATAGVKLLAVTALVVAAAMLPHTASQAASAVPLGPAVLAPAIMSAFFAFGGWWDLGRIAEDVTHPRHILPIALVGGVVIVTAMYATLTMAFAAVAPVTAGMTDESLVAAVGQAILGPRAGIVLAFAVAVAVGGSLAAVMFGAPRTYIAMTRDGVLSTRINWFDVERGRSGAATLVQAGLAIALVWLGTFDQILGYFVPSVVAFLGMAAIALGRLRQRAPHAHAFRTPWHPVPLILFLCLTGVVLLLFVAGQPRQSLLGALVVAAAIVIDRRRRRSSSRSVTEY